MRVFARRNDHEEVELYLTLRHAQVVPPLEEAGYEILEDEDRLIVPLHLVNNRKLLEARTDVITEFKISFEDLGTWPLTRKSSSNSSDSSSER
jgi:hypothetical protein